MIPDGYIMMPWWAYVIVAIFCYGSGVTLGISLFINKNKEDK